MRKWAPEIYAHIKKNGGAHQSELVIALDTHHNSIYRALIWMESKDLITREMAVHKGQPAFRYVLGKRKLEVVDK